MRDSWDRQLDTTFLDPVEMMLHDFNVVNVEMFSKSMEFVSKIHILNITGVSITF